MVYKKSKNDLYDQAQKLESENKLAKAIKLYKESIEKYDDAESKVALAKIYLSGKMIIPQNKKARQLLIEAHNQGATTGGDTLAYVYLNGIGGKVNKAAAGLLYKQELIKNNPNPDVYIGLSKIIEDKAVSKSFRDSVTDYEMSQYNRRAGIDKLNNTVFGKIINFVPNIFANRLKSVVDYKNDVSFGYNLNDLYKKANEFCKYGQFEEARRIFKRLAYYGDEDSKIKYAKMCLMGKGGPVNYDIAAGFFEECINNNEKKLNYYERQLRSIDEDLSHPEEFSKKDLKILQENKEYYMDKLHKAECNTNYQDSRLNYGLLLTTERRTQEDFNYGINILKSFAEKGLIEGDALSKNSKLKNRRAQSAAYKLAILYKNGLWKESNKEYLTRLFSKYEASNVSEITSSILDNINTDISIQKTRVMQPVTEAQRVEKQKEEAVKEKKSRLRFEVGSLCDLIGMKKVARKLYTSMSELGDYRCSAALASMENRGVGGEKDNASAKKHFREYINSTRVSDDPETIKYRNFAIKRLGDVLSEEKSDIYAATLYLIAAKNGEKSAKRELQNLYIQGRWTPRSQYEKSLVDTRRVKRALSKPKVVEPPKVEKTPRPIRTIEKPVIISTSCKRKVAAAVTAAAVGVSMSGLGGNMEVIAAKDSKSQYNFTIGDEVLVKSKSDIDGKNNVQHGQIVAVAGVNPKTMELLDLNDNYQMENYGLTRIQYLQTIKDKGIQIPEEGLKFAFFVKNGEGLSKWISSESDEFEVIVKHPTIKAKKREDDYEIIE